MHEALSPFELRRHWLRAGAAGATAAAAALLSAPRRARAQTGTARLVVGYPAGGAVDVAARALADALRGPLGVSSIVVENKPGAGGTLAVETWRQLPPDGLNLLFTPPDPIAIAPNGERPLRYDPAEAVPVAQVCTFGFALGVGPSVPARTFAEFVAWAKANPDKAAYGTPGIGSSMHFIGTEIERRTGIAFNHVPYKGGAQAIVDVTGGQLASLISTSPIVVPQHRGGRLRVLAVTTPKRSKALPDVPTFAELGFTSLVEDAWFGVFARQGTAPAAIGTLAEAIRQAVASSAFVQAMEKLDFDPEYLGPAEFAAAVRSKTNTWRERVRTTGFKMQ